MESKIEMAHVYDTLLCSPGMEEIVKIDLRISRKTILILSHAIQKGAASQEKAGLPSLPENVEKEYAQLLDDIASDCLQKAGLQVLSQKLKALIIQP